MKRRVDEIALRASLRTLCAGLMKLRGEEVPCDEHTPPSCKLEPPRVTAFSPSQLDRLFTNIRLTIAEIEAGCNSYKAIEDLLVKAKDCG